MNVPDNELQEFFVKAAKQAKAEYEKRQDQAPKHGQQLADRISEINQLFQEDKIDQIEFERRLAGLGEEEAGRL